MKATKSKARPVIELEQRIVTLEKENEVLRAQLELSKRRVIELEVRLAQNSTNSSRPPSSDSPNVGKKKRKVRAKKGKRKRGGQPGHKRHERALAPESEVAEMIPVKPSRCRTCEKPLRGSDPEPYRHQVVEIPPIEPRVTEWQLHSLSCRHCSATTRAELPEGVPSGNFGPRLQALVSICSGVYRLSKRKTCELLKDICGVELSLGSIAKLERKTSTVLAQPIEEAHHYVQSQPVVHADETSWKEGGRKAWLWLMATATVAIFLIRPTRSKKVAEELLGRFTGILVSDRYGGYSMVEAKKRQLCWAHLLRNIEAFRAWGLGSKRLATQLQRPMRSILKLYARVRDGTLPRCELEKQAEPLRLEILYHLRRGQNWRINKISGVCRKILTLEHALFTFLNHQHVEPTNNHAERLLRHPVLWRKSSFGTDSSNGSRFVERILTTVMTLRLQNRNALKYLTKACTAALHGAPLPSLLPLQSARHDSSQEHRSA